MSERWRKFQMFVLRFIVWLTASWLWRKFQLLLLRRIVERNPAEVDHKIRATARAMAQEFGKTGPSEEELVASQKRCLDSMLHPQD